MPLCAPRPRSRRSIPSSPHHSKVQKGADWRPFSSTTAMENLTTQILFYTPLRGTRRHEEERQKAIVCKKLQLTDVPAKSKLAGEDHAVLLSPFKLRVPVIFRVSSCLRDEFLGFLRVQFTQRRALRNILIHGPSSPQESGCQEFCTVRNTRSACGIKMVKRPSAVVRPVIPCGEPFGLNG